MINMILYPIVSHSNIFKPPKVTMVLNKQDVETSWDGHRKLNELGSWSQLFTDNPVDDLLLHQGTAALLP